MKKNRKKLKSIDAVKILSERIPIQSGDKMVQLSPDEIGIRRLVNRAINGDMNAAKQVVNRCLNFGILDQRNQTPYCPGHLIVPDHWNWNQWNAKYKRHGMPPWPGPDDGFSEECRTEYRYWRKHGHHSWADKK